MGNSNFISKNGTSPSPSRDNQVFLYIYRTLYNHSVLNILPKLIVFIVKAQCYLYTIFTKFEKDRSLWKSDWKK